MKDEVLFLQGQWERPDLVGGASERDKVGMKERMKGEAGENDPFEEF